MVERLTSRDLPRYFQNKLTAHAVQFYEGKRIWRAMKYDEALAVANNPRIRSVKRLLEASSRLIESGKESDRPLADQLRERAFEQNAKKPL